MKFNVMYVGKPFRILAAGTCAGVVTGFMLAKLHRQIGWWAVIAAVISFPINWLLGEWAINKLDFWLRRITKARNNRKKTTIS